jgi:hypothetical protein
MVLGCVDVQKDVLGRSPAAYHLQREAVDPYVGEQVGEPEPALGKVSFNLREARDRVKGAQGLDTAPSATLW